MAVTGVPIAAGSLGVAITVPDALIASDFYARAFGAIEIARYVIDDHPPSVGPVKSMHLKIGDAAILVSTANPRDAKTMDAFGPKTPAMLGGVSSALTLFVDDVDAALKRAVIAGARLAHAAQDAIWGDRVAVIEDPFGHVWGLAKGLEEISPDEHNRRWAAHVTRTAPPRLEMADG